MAASNPSKRPSLFKLLTFLLLACSFAIAATPADVHAIAQAVDNRYNRLQSLQTEFTESYSGMGTDRTESGILWLKKPGKMRWEYRTPHEKLFLSDGKDTWFYLPGDRQARRTPVKQLDDLRSPLAFLLGKAKLEKELEGLSIAQDVTPVAAGNVVLRGVPKAMADRVNQVVLEINPEHWIVGLTIDQVDGSRTAYRFSEQKENLAISDQRFRFELPAGVEVVDGNLQP